MAPRNPTADCGVASATLTVVQLRKKLKELGQSVAGSKLELVERLEYALARGTGAGSEADAEAAEGPGAKRKAPASPAAEGAASKRARLEGAACGEADEGGPPAAKRPRPASQLPAGAGEAADGPALSVKYAGKDQAKSKNVCIRGLPASLYDADGALKSLLEGLGLNVGRIKTVPASLGGGGSLAMVQLASWEEASFAILALDGEDATTIFSQMHALAKSGDSAQAARQEVPSEGGVPTEELERFREMYPMDERAFEYIQTASIEVQRHFLGTFKPPAVQEDYSRIVTTHLRSCQRQREEYAAHQGLEAQFGGGSVPQEQLDEFCALYPMDDRARDYLRVAPLAVQEEVLNNFVPRAEEKDYSRMVTAHIKFCIKLLRQGSPQEVLVQAPSTAEASVPEGELENFLQRYPMDTQAFEYLKISPPEVQLEVLRNFRPQAEELDYSRMVTAHINFCMKQFRGGGLRAAPAPALGQAVVAVPAERLDEFLARFPMDEQAFDYLKKSPPAVQLQVIGNFRPRSEEADYSRMVTAYIKRCTQQLREGSLVLTHASTQAEAAALEGPLNEFLERFPMDEQAFDYLKKSPPAVQQQVLNEFRPQAEEPDYSRMVTAFIKRCTTQLLKAALAPGQALALAPSSSETAVADEELNDFLERFPMDQQAFDFLKISAPAVQRQVLSGFKPLAKGSDYSKMVTAYIKHCTARHREGALKTAPLLALAPAPAPAQGQSEAEVAEEQLNAFLERFPMDQQAFDFLKISAPAVQQHVMSEFRPQAEESDYSRMVTAFIKRCTVQHREGSLRTPLTPALAPAPTLAASPGETAEADEQLNEFLARFPMDEQAFDYLRKSPPAVQWHVLSEFRPQAEDSDYSRMVMAFIKRCTQQFREGSLRTAPAPSQGEAGVSDEELNEFLERFPMDQQAFDYLKISPPGVQRQVLHSFRPQAEDSDYSRMVTAYINRCKQQRSGAAAAAPGASSRSTAVAAPSAGAEPQVGQILEAVATASASLGTAPAHVGQILEAVAAVLAKRSPGVDDLAAQLEQFRASFPMDDQAFDYLVMAPQSVQERVINTFNPRGAQGDFSRMVTAHIKFCLKQAGGDAAALVGTGPADAAQRGGASWAQEGATSAEDLVQFRANFPMDERAFDYLQASSPSVQARVINTFRPQAEETDYSRMVTAHVRYCRQQARDAGSDVVMAAPGHSGASSQWGGNGGSTDGGAIQDDALEQFRQRFPMDDRAFDYLKVSAPEVQARVVNTFKPQSEEEDYSRMVTGHIKWCTRQHREGSGSGWSGSGSSWSGADSWSASRSSGSGGVSSWQLEEFRSTYPMDDRAFDYLKVSPAEVQERVVRTFKPPRQESDYSRMVTGHIRYCRGQHRESGGRW